jgi:acetyl esterase/lipase
LARFSPDEFLERVSLKSKPQLTSWHAARAELEAAMSADQAPEGTQTVGLTIDGIRAEWVFVGDIPSENPVIVHIHGGGFTMGSCNSHRTLAAHLSEACRARVLTFEYRLAPENSYPCALEDALAVWAWVSRQPGIDSASVVMSGDSAGGALAASTVLALRSRGEVLPAGLVGISPWLDLTCTSSSMTERANLDPMLDRADLLRWAHAYLRDCDPKDPLVSPIYGSWEGGPPTLLQVGTNEILVDDARRMHRVLIDAGVQATLQEWPMMVHVWHRFPGLIDGAREALDSIGVFVASLFPTELR